MHRTVEKNIPTRLRLFAQLRFCSSQKNHIFHEYFTSSIFFFFFSGSTIRHRDWCLHAWLIRKYEIGNYCKLFLIIQYQHLFCIWDAERRGVATWISNYQQKPQLLFVKAAKRDPKELFYGWCISNVDQILRLVINGLSSTI